MKSLPLKELHIKMRDCVADLVHSHRTGDFERAREFSQEKEKLKKAIRQSNKQCADCGTIISSDATRCYPCYVVKRYHRQQLKAC